MGITITIKITTEKEGSVEPYDKEKFSLGKLCLNGHEYGSTGKSLRYKKNYVCVACSVAWAHEQRVNNPKKVNEWQKTAKTRLTKELRDPYIKNQLKVQYGLSYDQITPELIQMKREQLTLIRKIRRVKNAYRNCRNGNIG